MKIAVITGASSGLGKEFFLQLENEYDEVWMIARREEKMKAISELRPEIKAKIVKLDLLKKEAFHIFDELLTQNDADIRLLINNAGYGLLGDFDEMETDGQTGIVRLNNEALVGMTSVALKHMHDGAQIINIRQIPLPRHHVDHLQAREDARHRLPRLLFRNYRQRLQPWLRILPCLDRIYGYPAPDDPLRGQDVYERAARL